jgi:hypothetical protein
MTTQNIDQETTQDNCQIHNSGVTLEIILRCCINAMFWMPRPAVDGIFPFNATTEKRRPFIREK